MLKMARLDCVVINEKCCSVDRGRSICPYFSDLTAQESPPPGNAIQGKKMLMLGDLPGDQPGGKGGRGCWELTDA